MQCFSYGVQSITDHESHVSSSYSWTIAVPWSITLGKLFYRLSNCTIWSLSFCLTPHCVSDYTKVMSHFSAGMERSDRHERLVGKWQLHRAAMPNRIIWEPILGLARIKVFFHKAVISYRMTGLASQRWLEKWTVTENGRKLQMADRENM